MAAAPRQDTIELNKLVKKPTIFDGENPHPRVWIEEYLHAAEDNGWTERQAVRYFKTFIKGDASDWYDWAVRPIMTNETTLDTVRDLFSTNYLGQADGYRTRKLLRDTKQGPNDLACNFIPRIVKLLLILDPQMSESEQVARITEKLAPFYQRTIAEHEPSSVVQLRDLCRKVEAGLDAMRSNAEYRPKKSSTWAKASGFIPDRGSHGSRSRQASRPQRRPSNDSAESEDGHSSQTKRDSKGRGNKQDKDLECYRCNRKGHMASKCFARTKLDGTKLQPKQANLAMADESSEDEEVVVKQVYSLDKAINTPYLGLITHDVYCNDELVKGTFDTGANVTVLNAELARKLNLEIRPISSQIRGAGKKSLDCLGATKLTITVRIGTTEKSLRLKVYVINNLARELLVGTDLMSKFEIVIDTNSRTIGFSKTRKLPKTKSGSAIVTTEKTEIPPRGQMIVSGRIPSHLNGKDVLVVPSQVHDKIAVANSVSTVRDGEVNVLVLNPGNEPVKLKKDQKLASFEEHVPHVSKLPLEGSEEFIKVGDKLNEAEIRELRGIVHANIKAFSLSGELGLTNILTHKIELTDNSKTVAEPLRRRPYEQIVETSKQVKKLLDEGIIEPSDSPWASAYVLAKKKSGEWRLCIDFRRLNDLTKKSVYPLPLIEDCLDTLSGKSYFSLFDFASGFWQIPMDPDSKELTAFRTEDGHFQFTRMPFGLTNAPASFQKMINILLAGLKGLNVQVFIDDVCIATHTWEEHKRILNQILVLIAEANLKLKPSKCLFGASRVIFLGHEISNEGIRQDPAKLRAIQKLPSPTDVAGVRRWLGFVSYYRKFLPNFARLVAVIVHLLKKGVQFEWTAQHEEAKNTVNRLLAENVTLANFNHKDPVMLKTDASKEGVAGMLLQQQKGVWKLVYCCSRRLSKSELNYGITDLEGLAVIYAVQKLRSYLLGKHFKILVDHCALCVLNKRMPTSARLRRWAIVLSEFDYEIQYVKGELHKDVDCLSRAPVDNQTDAYLEDKVYAVCIPVNENEWISLYDDDTEAQDFLAKASNGEDHFNLRSNVIYFKDKIYVPKSKRDEIIQNSHSNVLAGHGGVEVTLHKMNDLWWPTLKRDVQQFVSNCLQCQTKKINRHPPSGEIRHFHDYLPLTRIAADTFGPIRETTSGKKYVIVIIDMFTRHIETVATEDQKAEVFVEMLEGYLCRYGPPEILLTDNGPQFKNQHVGKLLKLFGVKHEFSTPEHSESNAVVERAIQTVEEKLNLAIVTESDAQNWDRLLAIVTFAINTSINQTTQYTPYELMFGRELIPRNAATRPSCSAYDLHAQLIKNQQEKNQRQANENQLHKQDRSERHMRYRYHQTFKVGDKVLMRTKVSRKAKLVPNYVGPYVVLEKKGDVYVITNDEGKSTLQRHTRMLKPYPQGESSPHTVSWIYALTLFMQLITYTRADLFEYAAPLLIAETEKIALDENGVEHYTLNVLFEDPCETLLTNPTKCVELDKAYMLQNASWEYTETVLRSRLKRNANEYEYENTSAPYWLDAFGPTNDKKVLPQTSAQYSGEPAINSYSAPALSSYSAPALSSYPDAYPYRIAYSSSHKGYVYSNAPPPAESFCKENDCSFCYKRNNTVLRKMKQQCSRVWEEEVVRRVYQMGSVLNRNERSVTFLAGAAVGTAATIVVNSVCYAVKSVISWFTGNSNEVRMEDFLQLRKQTLTLTEVTQSLLSKVTSMDKRLLALEVEWQSLTDGLSDYIWAALKIYGSIMRLAHRLDLIETHREKKQIDPSSMASAFNLNAIKDVEPRDTTLKDVKLIADQVTDKLILQFSFIVNRKSNSTSIYEIIPFHYWNITDRPRLMKYSGERLMLYNQSTNCKLAIYTQERIVQHNCTTPDFEDEMLKLWTIEKTVESLHETFSELPQQHGNKYHQFIYCFPYNITIAGKTSRCPQHVFKLANSISWETKGHRFRPMFFSLNASTNTQEFPFDRIYWTNVNEPNTVGEVYNWINRSEHYQQVLSEYQNTHLSVHKSTAWNASIILIVLILLASICAAVYCNRKQLCYRQATPSAPKEVASNTAEANRTTNTPAETIELPPYPENTIQSGHHISKLAA